MPIVDAIAATTPPAMTPSPRLPVCTKMAMPIATVETSVPTYGMMCTIPVDEPPHSGVGRRRAPPARPTWRGRSGRWRRAASACSAWIWPSISFSTSTVTRRRASDAPAILATLRRNVSPAASRKSASSNATKSSARTDSAWPDCCATNSWNCACTPAAGGGAATGLPAASAAALSSSAAAAFMCDIGPGDCRSESATAWRSLRAAPGSSATQSFTSSRSV